jgi:hypothetical protein
MITRDTRSVASGVAADRDQAANDAAAALGELPRLPWTWGTLGVQTGSAHGSTTDSLGKRMAW